jgi:hypothetical protein
MVEHKKTTAYDVGIPGSATGTKCAGIKPDNGIPTLPS